MTSASGLASVPEPVKRYLISLWSLLNQQNPNLAEIHSAYAVVQLAVEGQKDLVVVDEGSDDFCVWPLLLREELVRTRTSQRSTRPTNKAGTASRTSSSRSKSGQTQK
jgi:hypothetical protein